MFIVNDFDLGDKYLRAEDIIDSLLTKKIWVFTPYAPFIKYLGKGDKIILYLAGNKRKFFYGSFEIAGSIEECKFKPENPKESLIKDIFTLSCPIDQVDKWPKKVSMYEVLDKLRFIEDRKNWGLHIRQSARAICREDFDLLYERGHMN